MDRDFPNSWMWSEACEMLARAERLHREFFRPARAVALIPPSWEPPIDILETEHEVLVLVALPGVKPEGIEATIEDGVLILGGVRILPPQLRTATIHRLEIPQGRFERRLRLPTGHYSDVRLTAVDGCLTITLRKAESFRG
jgi:HSP20 family protein